MGRFLRGIGRTGQVLSGRVKKWEVRRGLGGIPLHVPGNEHGLVISRSAVESGKGGVRAAVYGD